MVKKRQKREKPTQLLMLGITIEPPRPPRLDDMAMFEGHEVRMVHRDGETWWVAADVCQILGIDNHRQAVTRLEEDEKGVISNDTLGGKQEMLTVNEPGLYSLIFTSRKAEAKRFKRWVFHEVLPTIRRSGSYSMVGPRLARTKHRLNCDDATATVRLRLVGGNKAFHSLLATHGAAPIHYMRAHDSIYAGVYAGKNTRELRKDLGLRKRTTPMDHMSRFALDVQLAVTSLAERCLEEMQKAGSPISLADQPTFIKAKAEEATRSLLTILGPGDHLGITNDPRRGLIVDVVRKQLTADPSPGDDADADAGKAVVA